MIKELSELGKKVRTEKTENGSVVHDALKEEPFSIDLIIRDDGSFHSFRTFEKIMRPAEALTSKKGKARLLLDKAEEVLDYGNKSSAKHKLFIKKLEEYKNVRELSPVFAFYHENKANGMDQALSEFENQVTEKERNGNIAISLLNESERIHEKQAVVNSIIEHYENAQKSLLKKSNVKCSICGKTEHPVVDIPHGMFQGVPGSNQPSGRALVSYNEDAFESYKLKGNLNSTICTNCAKAYVEGLNVLLSKGNPVINEKGKEIFKYTNRRNFGNDTAMVFWTRDNTKVDEMDLFDDPEPGEVADLIDSLALGDVKSAKYLDSDKFYSCTLSGAAARIVVRDWIETSLTDFRESIAHWFKDIAIGHFSFDLKKNETYYPPLYRLAGSCQNNKEDKKVTLSRTASYLWNAALKNTPVPLWILTTVLKRTQLDGVTRERAALIKLILNRKNKGGGFMINENLAENGSKPVAYVCGQIFSVFESIQYAALGEVNAGIRERYFSFALTNPALAFGRLFNLSAKHFTKLKREKPGLAVTLDKKLQSLCNDINIEDLSSIFSLEEQGQFAIGYYHQKQASFNKDEIKETIKEEE